VPHTRFFIPWEGLVIRHFCIQCMGVVNCHKHFAGEEMKLTLFIATIITGSTIRFCAVFGGVYVLRRSIASVILNENKYYNIQCL